MTEQPASEKAGLPIIAFADPAECLAWFEVNAADSLGFWLKIAKKSNPETSCNYLEALDVALCFGWIDSQKATFDEGWFLQRFTPRRPKGKWSQVNRVKVQNLIDAGLMRPGGQAEIDAAKADGRWDAAYPPPSRMEVPEDLAAALEMNPEAKAFFATMNSANRYAVMFRIHDAKRPETRARKIADFVEMLNQHQTVDMWAKRPKTT